MLQHLVRMHGGNQGRAKRSWEDEVSWLAWEHYGILPEALARKAVEKSPRPRHRQADEDDYEISAANNYLNRKLINLRLIDLNCQTKKKL